jgi:hypothetical protein
VTHEAREQFLAERVRALAAVILKRRDDSTITATKAWLAEPLVTDTAPKLIHHDKAHCIEFTDELLSRVVDQVVAWYDAVKTVLIA